MISDFSFEPSVVVSPETMPAPAIDAVRPLGLQLPLTFPDDILNLGGMALSIEACLAHFAPLQLEWNFDHDPDGEGMRGLAVFDLNRETGGIWGLMVLDRTATGLHRHNGGGAYGECVITLAGELEDTLDNGSPVLLQTGAVMFHAADTTHEARTTRFWVGLYHQPRGCTPVG